MLYNLYKNLIVIVTLFLKFIKYLFFFFLFILVFSLLFDWLTIFFIEAKTVFFKGYGLMFFFTMVKKNISPILSYYGYSFFFLCFFFFYWSKPIFLEIKQDWVSFEQDKLNKKEIELEEKTEYKKALKDFRYVIKPSYLNIKKYKYMIEWDVIELEKKKKLINIYKNSQNLKLVYLKEANIKALKLKKKLKS